MNVSTYLAITVNRISIGDKKMKGITDRDQVETF